MQISRTCFGANSDFCKLVANAGYGAVDINDTSHNPEVFLKSEDEQVNFVENVVKNINTAGLVIGQCHAPHTKTLWCTSPEEFEQNIVTIENCIKIASKLHIPYTVVHPIVYAFNNQGDNPDKIWQINIDMLRRVTKYAENTVVCLENMPGTAGVIRTGDDMKRMLADVGNNDLMVCLDTGHLISQEGNFFDFFSAVGDRVKTTHIHDSLKGQDLHLLVGTGQGDWQDFKDAIKQYNYTGNINSESVFVYKTPDELTLEGQILERRILEGLIK
jgi:sugar phosphate isomerase/epimerase